MEAAFVYAERDSTSRRSGTASGKVKSKEARTRCIVSMVRPSGETCQVNSPGFRPSRSKSWRSSLPLRSAWLRPISLSGISLEPW